LEDVSALEVDTGATSDEVGQTSVGVLPDSAVVVRVMVVSVVVVLFISSVVVDAPR